MLRKTFIFLVKRWMTDSALLACESVTVVADLVVVGLRRRWLIYFTVYLEANILVIAC